MVYFIKKKTSWSNQLYILPFYIINNCFIQLRPSFTSLVIFLVCAVYSNANTNHCSYFSICPVHYIFDDFFFLFQHDTLFERDGPSTDKSLDILVIDRGTFRTQTRMRNHLFNYIPYYWRIHKLLLLVRKIHAYILMYYYCGTRLAIETWSSYFAYNMRT